MEPDFSKLKPVEDQPNFSTLKPIVPEQPTGESALSSGGNGLKNIATDILGTSQNDSQSFIPSVIQSTYGSKGLAGVAQLPGRTAAALSEYAPFVGQHQAEGLYAQASTFSDQAAEQFKQARLESDPKKQSDLRIAAYQAQKSANDLIAQAETLKKQTDTTPGQALGTTLNAGLTAATGGLGSLEDTAGANLLGKVRPALAPLAEGTSFVNKTAQAINYGGRVAENAGLGLGFNTASNLENGKPLGEGAVGASILGAAIPFAGSALSATKGVIGNALGSTADGIIGSLIKPLDKNFAYGKDPIRGILDEGITANSFEQLSEKVGQTRQDIGSQIGDIGDKLTESGATLDLSKALNPLDTAMRRAASLGNQPLVDSIFSVKQSLTHDMGLITDKVTGRPIVQAGIEKDLSNLDYSQAVKFLSDITDHTKFTGNPSDDKALNATTKQAYGVVREIMNNTADKVDPQIGSELRNLNSRYSDISSAQLAINHRELALKRQNFLSLADRFGFGASLATSLATGLISGDWAKAGLVLAGELTALGASKTVRSTAVQTRVAQFLNALAPSEKDNILRATPALKEYYQRLFGSNKSEGGIVNHITPESVNLNPESMGGVNKIPITNSEPPLPPMVDSQTMDMGSYKLGQDSVGRVTTTDFREPNVPFYKGKKKK